MNLDFTFYMPKMEQILTEALKGIKMICPNSTHLLWFWHIKNAELERKWDEIDDSKDTYDRQDNFNVIGLATYLFLQHKETLCHITG